MLKIHSHQGEAVWKLTPDFFSFFVLNNVLTVIVFAIKSALGIIADNLDVLTCGFTSQ